MLISQNVFNMAVRRSNWIHAAVGTSSGQSRSLWELELRKTASREHCAFILKSVRPAGKIADFWVVIWGHLECSSSRYEGSFCLHIQGQTIQKYLSQPPLFQSFPTYWPVLDWLTEHFSACWLIKWLSGCITARFVCLLEWLIDRVLRDRPVVWFFCSNGCLSDQMCVNDWLTGINHGTKFCVINRYSCGPTNCCYTARISFLLSNQL